jgi:predicted metallopeptidase
MSISTVDPPKSTLRVLARFWNVPSVFAEAVVVVGLVYAKEL